MPTVCQSCQSEDLDLDSVPPFCNDCGEEFDETDGVQDGSENLIVVGLIVESEPVPKKDKLTKLKVDVGGGNDVTVVTNAKYCDVGKKIVVAKVGASVPTMDEPVGKAAVGGVKSEGMVCDCPMLGWTGGAAGQAVFLPDSFNPGDKPPSSRPRA